MPVKSEQQQACLALHRMRSQLMKVRIMQTNALRGLLYEFGVVLPEGHHALLQKIHAELAKAGDRLPGVITESVLEQPTRINKLQEDIDHIDGRLVAVSKQNPWSRPAPPRACSMPLSPVVQARLHCARRPDDRREHRTGAQAVPEQGRVSHRQRRRDAG
jgi:transposase